MFAVSAGAVAAEDVVHIGMACSVSNGAELIAIEKGYFRDAGIKVEMEDIDTSANTLALLAQNRLQIVAGRDAAGDDLQAVLREQRERVGGGVDVLHLDLDAGVAEVALLDRDQLGAVRHRARHADMHDVLRGDDAGRHREHERSSHHRTQ